MGAAIKQQHIMQAVDWSKYDLQDWLRQCGLWQSLSLGRGSGGSGLNPIYQAMKKAKLKINSKDRAKLISYYLCDDESEELRIRVRETCLISDDEARAVQKLVLDIINNTNSEVQLEWMDAIIGRYFNMRSWSQMQTANRTVMDAKYDVRCGLATLHTKYSFLVFTKGKI
ncbi:hypothetical protein [Acinetobacter nectaris]|uniref:hypothetical protein n=1 Tax=Acinetobacter nectaris TaxID=1219382 RepID=UPI001F438BE8|nr:hypothetical protein [Acinetobacter nectaris]MCF9035290.1 hypothetical protein [Acinetobacter nectaris]